MSYIIPNKFVKKCWVFFEPIGGVSDTRDKKNVGEAFRERSKCFFI